MPQSIFFRTSNLTFYKSIKMRHYFTKKVSRFIIKPLAYFIDHRTMTLSNSRNTLNFLYLTISQIYRKKLPEEECR